MPKSTTPGNKASNIIDVFLDLFINFYVTTGSGIRLKRLQHWFVSHPRTDFFFINAHTEHYYCIIKIAQPNKPLGDTRVWKLLCTIKKKSNSSPKDTHCCVHYSCSVSSNWISNVSDIDSVQVFVITCSFNEDLKGRRGKMRLFTQNW